MVWWNAHSYRAQAIWRVNALARLCRPWSWAVVALCLGAHLSVDAQLGLDGAVQHVLHEVVRRLVLRQHHLIATREIIIGVDVCRHGQKAG